MGKHNLRPNYMSWHSGCSLASATADFPEVGGGEERGLLRSRLPLSPRSALRFSQPERGKAPKPRSGAGGVAGGGMRKRHGAPEADGWLVVDAVGGGVCILRFGTFPTCLRSGYLSSPTHVSRGAFCARRRRGGALDLTRARR